LELQSKVSRSHGGYTQKSVGLDPGFGSSNFDVCITELRGDIVNVLHAEEYNRPDFNEMIKTTVRLLDEYDIRFDNSCRIFVDGANPSFIRALKAKVGENTEYEGQIARWKSEKGAALIDLDWISNNMFVLPFAFARYHKEMLANTKEVMEYHNGRIAIHPSFNKLITSLRTAVENGEGQLDKEATSHDDDIVDNLII